MIPLEAGSRCWTRFKGLDVLSNAVSKKVWLARRRGELGCSRVEVLHAHSQQTRLRGNRHASFDLQPHRLTMFEIPTYIPSLEAFSQSLIFRWLIVSWLLSL